MSHDHAIFVVVICGDGGQTAQLVHGIANARAAFIEAIGEEYKDESSDVFDDDYNWTKDSTGKPWKFVDQGEDYSVSIYRINK